MTRQLRPYQEVARDFLRANDHAALFLDMGLGKTAATLQALEPRHLPALVCAPKRVAEATWPEETALWGQGLTCAVAAGDPAHRAAQLQRTDVDVIAVGRDNLADALVAAKARARKGQGYRTLVLDELSGFKAKRSQRWRNARKIINTGVDHVWGLTGTPNPNGYMDLWSQIYLLDGGARLGQNLTTYRSRYFDPGRRLPNGVITKWNIREGSAAQIKAKIEDIVLAMATGDRVQLPARTENRVTLQLPPKASRVYADMAQDLVVDMNELLGGGTYTAKNAAALTSKLSQISAGFIYEDDRDLLAAQAPDHVRLHDVKLKALRSIVDEAQGSGVLVAYRYRVERDMILRELGSMAHTLDGDAAATIAAWNRGDVPVLVAHPASAGHGLNLQYGGHTIVWTSLSWDLELWDQFNKRLARPGQQHPVVVHVLNAAGIDTTIRASLDDKSVVQEDLLSYLECPL